MLPSTHFAINRVVPLLIGVRRYTDPVDYLQSIKIIMLTTIKKISSLSFTLALTAGLSLLIPQVVQAETTVNCVLDQEILKDISIANFEQVNETILRGAAPSDQNLRLLAKSGIKTVVDLRKPGSGVKHESDVARELGMNYIHIPLGFTSPDVSEMKRILGILNQSSTQPVFVHCRQGADRTGMTIGMYRRIHDKWEFNKTYGEMRKHHFKPLFRGMKTAVKMCLQSPTLVSAILPVEQTITASQTNTNRTTSNN
jgi:protein tyrosine phosphatase (PTP) superfamily phosphohydrolase (DUF442 family)